MECVDDWERVEKNKDGKTDDKFGFLKVDVVGHSKITAWWPYKTTARVFDRFEKYVEVRVNRHCGKIWSWLGDGGLCAFLGPSTEELVQNTYKAAESILEGLDNFNDTYRFPNREDKISVRIAAHVGDALYRGQDSLGRIHSEAINFVAHLEAKRTYVNSISISQDFYKKLDGIMKDKFVKLGDFKDAGTNHVIYTNARDIKGNFQPEEWELIWDENRCERLKEIIGQLQPHKELLTTRYSPRPINHNRKSREYVKALNNVIDEKSDSSVYRIISLDDETKANYAKDLIEKHGENTNFALAVVPYHRSILDLLVVNNEEVCFGIQTGDENKNFWIRVRDLRLAGYVAQYYHEKLFHETSVKVIKKYGTKMGKDVKNNSKVEIDDLYKEAQMRSRVIDRGYEMIPIFTSKESTEIRKEIYELARINAEKEKDGIFYSVFLNGTKKREGDFYDIIKEHVQQDRLNFCRVIVERNKDGFQDLIKNASGSCGIYTDLELSKLYEKRHYFLGEILPNAIIYTHDACKSYRAFLDFTVFNKGYGFGMYTKNEKIVKVLEKRIERYLDGCEKIHENPK